MNLKDIADDLARFLGGDKKEEKVPPAVLQDEDRNAAIARYAFDYVLSVMAEDDTASTIGKSLMLGAMAAAAEMGLNEDDVSGAMLQFLGEIVESAKEIS